MRKKYKTKFPVVIRNATALLIRDTTNKKQSALCTLRSSERPAALLQLELHSNVEKWRETGAKWQFQSNLIPLDPIS